MKDTFFVAPGHYTDKNDFLTAWLYPPPSSQQQQENQKKWFYASETEGWGKNTRRWQGHTMQITGILLWVPVFVSKTEMRPVVGYNESI